MKQQFLYKLLRETEGGKHIKTALTQNKTAGKKTAQFPLCDIFKNDVKKDNYQCCNFVYLTGDLEMESKK